MSAASTGISHMKKAEDADELEGVSSSENVQVAVRIRPSLSTRAATSGPVAGTEERAVISTGRSDLGQVVITVTDTSSTADPPRSRDFSFENVLDESATQEEVYDKCAARIVDGVLDGYDGSVLAYGETTSGKTFSMLGVTEGRMRSEVGQEPSELRGIIPRAGEHVFTRIGQLSQQGAPPTTLFNMSVSFLQLHREMVHDLLQRDKSFTPELKLREKRDTGLYVDGLLWVPVKCLEDYLGVMHTGWRNLIMHTTHMGDSTARVHLIFTVQLRCVEIATGRQRTSQLQLVDMAGSERRSHHTFAGAALTEARTIGRSLDSFKSVISALTSAARHVPYRDSKITRLLRNSLGGRARCLILATVGIAPATSIDETMSTLLVALRVCKVRNFPVINKFEDAPEMAGASTVADIAIGGPHTDIAAGSLITALTLKEDDGVGRDADAQNRNKDNNHGSDLKCSSGLDCTPPPPSSTPDSVGV